MDISLNIILEELESSKPLCYIRNRSVRFSGISPIVNENIAKDKLIICNLSDALSSEGKSDNYFIVLIDCRLPKESYALMNMILIDEMISIPELFIRVQSIFDKYFNWCIKMDQCLIRNRGIQDILNLSEPVIGNFITISDSAFSLVAYTTGLTTNDELTKRLVENGYHDQEAINSFSKNGLPLFWRDMNDIYERPETVTSCPIMAKVIHYNNFYYSHVVMLCEKHPISPALRDKFQILIDRLMVCFERQWVENNQMPHVYDSLLIDLLNGKELDRDSIMIRAKNSGLPTSGYFRLAKISTSDHNGIMLQRLCQELSEKIPQARVTLSRDMLVVLVSMKSTREAYTSFRKKLQDILNSYDSNCGISDPFFSISDIRSAGQQADIALKARFGKELLINRFENRKTGRVQSFGECYPAYIMVGTKESHHISRQTWAYRALQKLYEYDRKHDTNNLELLYVYLSNERKASETSQIVHMHRNNVIYRIGKISEIIEVDLNSSFVRLRLLMAYEVFSPKGE